MVILYTSIGKIREAKKLEVEALEGLKQILEIL
jgi:hypothetical protein